MLKTRQHCSCSPPVLVSRCCPWVGPVAAASCVAAVHVAVVHVAVAVGLVGRASCLVKLLACHVCVPVAEAPGRAARHHAPAHAARLHRVGLHCLRTRAPPTAAFSVMRRRQAAGGVDQSEGAGWPRVCAAAAAASGAAAVSSGSQSTGRHA